MTSRNRDKSSDPTSKNTRYNARQQSHSIRTIACDIGPHDSPRSTQPSSLGRAGQDGSEIDSLASISLDSIHASARETNHGPNIKFSAGTKESDQPLSRVQWQRRATAAKKRDEFCEKQDPDGPDSPETGELRSEWWEDWQEEKARAKEKRAEERRAISGASESTESSHGSEKLSGSDQIQLSKRNEKSNGAEEARRTSAANDETPLRRRLVGPSRGHSGGGSETMGHARTVLPMRA